MYLPEYIRQCITTLEDRGFACYAVGGCVRDSLLDLVPHDYDLCTDALPSQIKEVFAGYNLILAGEKHGTIGVIIDGNVVEITTFRTEGDYSDNRHPGWVEFVKDIKDDLARRDFTSNAMAWSPTRGLVDPFGGQQDMRQGILRAVGKPDDRFKEDALRILRGMRFAARYDWNIDPLTLQAMFSHAPLLDHIAKERIYEELCKLLLSANVDHLLQFAPILSQVIPEIVPIIGFQQHNHHHAYDVFTHTAHVVSATPKELPLRWAALLHDLGKAQTFTMGDDGEGHFYGHDKVSAQIADVVLSRLKASNALREEVFFLISHHMMWLRPDRRLLRRWLSKWGKDRLWNLFYLQLADVTGKGIDDGNSSLEETRILLHDLIKENSCLTLKTLAINGHDLMQLGFTGTEIGDCLNDLLSKVVDEELPNEKAALLAAAKRRLP